MADCNNGKINIYHKTPSFTYKPQQICYTGDSGVEVCVSGDSYTIKKVYEGAYSAHVVLYLYRYFGGTPEIHSGDYYGNNFEGYTVIQQTIYGVYRFIRVDWKDSGGTRILFGLRYGAGDSPRIFNGISVQFASGEKYQVEVKTNNVITHTSPIFNNQPTVRIEPESQECTFNNSQWQLGKTINGKNVNFNTNNFTDITGKKCVKVIAEYFAERLNKNIKFPVFTTCSPNGCNLHPQIKTVSENNSLECPCDTKAKPFKVCCDEAFIPINNNGINVNAKDKKYDVDTGLLPRLPDIVVQKCIEGILEGDNFNIYVINYWTLFPFIRNKQANKVLAFSIDKCKVKNFKPPTCKKPPKPPKPPDEKCPPNTCYECIDNGYKCCYDGNLKLIKSFKI